ncbi:MAG: multicopper oxidase family protein, partial [Mycobacteriaceae bacterium]|nr:multicopper oxidase family protein [Mycobacteriaceae bacterium]
MLRTTLTNSPSAVELGGRRYITGAAYEQMVPGPTLVVQPGDRLVIRQRNRLPIDSTNVHVHGLHVSPAPGHDNVFLRLRAGHNYTNTYDIPADQYAGTYWYHPHWHMNVDYQTYDGMAGALIVRGSIDELPGIAGRRERTMVFQRMQLGDDGRVVPIQLADETKAQTFINGQLRPVIDIRPGEVQRWRIVNAQSDDFLRLAIDGQYFSLIGVDGTPERSPRATSIMLIPPGGRRTVLVRGAATGDHALRTLEWGTGFQYVAPAVLATVRTMGAPTGPQPLPRVLSDMPDLRQAQVAARRTVEFSEDLAAPENPRFLINGKTYDQWGTSDMFTMKRGTVEEWTLTNTSNEWHPFHIHVNPFQVIAINGVPQAGV